MKIKLIVDGGSMKPGPAVAQQLGPAGINLGKVIQDVNEATSGFKGIKVPIELDVDTKTKQYQIKIFSPPTSELIKKEIGVDTASGTSGKSYVGNLAIEQVISIANTKMHDMLAKEFISAVRLVVGSCVSAGVMIEGKNPRQVQKEIEEGKYYSEISSRKDHLTPEKKAEMAKIFSDISNKQEAEKRAAEAAKAAEEAAKAAAPTATATPAAGAEVKKEAKKEEKKETKKK